MKKKKIINNIVIAVLMLICILGVCLAFWDDITGSVRQKYTDGAIEAISENIGTTDEILYEIPDSDLLRVSGEDDEMTTLTDITTDISGYENSSSELTLIGLIEIPTVDVYEPVYKECDNLALRYGVAHYWNSYDLLSVEGNCSIMGHRFYEGNYAFTDLVLIEQGDYVYVTTVSGQIRTYEVVDSFYTTPEELPTYLDGEASDREQLTLTTCARENGDNWRFVCICRPVTVFGDKDKTENGGLYQPENGTITKVIRHDASDDRKEYTISELMFGAYNTSIVPILIIGLLLVIVLAMAAYKLYKKHH